VTGPQAQSADCSAAAAAAAAAAHLVHELVSDCVQEVRVVQQLIKRSSKRLLIIRVLHCSTAPRNAVERVIAEADQAGTDGQVTMMLSIGRIKAMRQLLRSQLLRQETCCC
jgi:uncharacterized protein YbjQ (UPF0145 family)